MTTSWKNSSLGRQPSQPPDSWILWPFNSPCRYWPQSKLFIPLFMVVQWFAMTLNLVWQILFLQWFIKLILLPNIMQNDSSHAINIQQWCWRYGSPLALVWQWMVPSAEPLLHVACVHYLMKKNMDKSVGTSDAQLTRNQYWALQGADRQTDRLTHRPVP